MEVAGEVVYDYLLEDYTFEKAIFFVYHFETTWGEHRTYSAFEEKTKWIKRIYGRDQIL